MTEPPGAGFRARILSALRATEAEDKAAIIAELVSETADEDSGDAPLFTAGQSSEEDIEPGRPARVELVDPRDVGRRGLGSTEGRACFLHAITHIEFNAINLALDIAWRFGGMPARFQRDWLGVAADEARHFTLLNERMRALGASYGDYPAHDGLWDIARKTRHDLLSRLAMVPCVMEARGLDVTPGMIRRLRAVGDGESAELLELILREEESHVAIGINWYRRVCAERALDPRDTFFDLLSRYLPNRVQGPLNLEQRRAAGFDADWLEQLGRVTAARTG